MKKILFVNHSLSNGGAERVMTLLANELSERNYSIEMLIQNSNGEETYKLNSCIKRIDFDSRGFIGKKYALSWLSAIRATMKKGSYDAVISFMMANNVLTLLANIGLKNGIIVSERCDPRRVEDYGRFFKCGEQILYPRAKKVVFQTLDVQSYYKNSIRKKSVVIPNPVNIDLLERSFDMAPRKVFVSAGRLYEQKNYPMLIKAFALLCKELDGYELEIYGQGPQLKNLKRLCIELNVEDKVYFKGYVNNVTDYMRSATAFVMSSDYEGISNAMIEALAMGVPTICTDCPVGGAKMMIESGVNGILVPVGNEQELAKAMINIACEPNLSTKLGREAVKIKEKYNIKKIADMWEILILS